MPASDAGGPMPESPHWQPEVEVTRCLVPVVPASGSLSLRAGTAGVSPALLAVATVTALEPVAPLPVPVAGWHLQHWQALATAFLYCVMS